MIDPEEVTLSFNSLAAERLGKALQHNCTAEYAGRRYWVVGARYRKYRDWITFRLSPAWFCHRI